MKFKHLLVFGLLVAILIAPLSVVAQEPGSGGPIIEGNFSGSPSIGSFLQLRCSGTDCDRIADLLYPSGLIGVDHENGVFAPNGEGGVASAWEVSEDGLTYTVTISDDAVWSDGTPITAADVQFTFEAIHSGEVESDVFGYMDEEGIGIQSVDIIDDKTVQFNMGAPVCDALTRIAEASPLPAHVFGYTPGEDFDFVSLIDHPYNSEPEVIWGPFQFAGTASGEQVALAANESFTGGTTVPAGFLYVDVPDQTVMVERFLAGELNFVNDPPQARRDDVRNSDAQVYNYAGNSWDYVGLNLADPANPQNGTDEDGNLIDQGNHPIFGDVRVRRAMQLGINVSDIVEGAVFGEGSQMASSELPTSWALNQDLPAIGFDQEAAAALLDEAGWVLEDGDVRVCRGCMYAEDGAPLEFDLQTNEGNTRREAIGQIVQDQLSEIGFQVNFEAIDFNTLIEFFQSQEFDAYILGWRNGYPVDPDQTQLFTEQGDVIAAGFNAGSYYNPRVSELMQLANDATTTNGCDPVARAEYYGEIQQILQDEQPYVWLFATDGMYAAGPNVDNFDPRANAPLWQSISWTIAQ
jgi:peptide/nickel transport system substrate-binding protein